jgi:hypothetical protein
MFGLMRAQTCGMTAEEKHFRRLNYCGTCKTAGSLYGQKSRLLLNHDTVFLAEILTALSGESVGDWETSYQSYNCLNLPKAEMPTALKFAATANVILTEFKIADHITDEKKRRFKFVRRVFSNEFLKAEKLLREWEFPLDAVREILQSQEEREAENFDLKSLVEPTAQTTALFFSEGAKLIGKPEIEEAALKIGYQFGGLIYLLDAFEDYEKDFKIGRFNAVRSVYDLNEAKIPLEIKRKVFAAIKDSESEIIAEIYQLPITESQKKIFASRLQQNLQRKLKTNLPVLQKKNSCRVKTQQSFTERWRGASKKASVLAKNYSWQMPLVFIFIFVFALAAPAQSREAKSARECFDLSFNLMFLGAVFSSVLSVPVLAMGKFGGGAKIAAETVEKKKPESWCDWCDCCDCCDCDCCGDWDGSCCDGCDCCDCCSCDC